MTKRLWKQRQIPNNEILDFLSRAPTDLELVKQKISKSILIFAFSCNGKN